MAVIGSQEQKGANHCIEGGLSYIQVPKKGFFQLAYLTFDSCYSHEWKFIDIDQMILFTVCPVVYAFLNNDS